MASQIREPRFRYAGPFRSQEKAADALSVFFASGEISEGERPQIVRYSLGLPREPKRADFWITLPQ